MFFIIIIFNFYFLKIFVFYHFIILLERNQSSWASSSMSWSTLEHVQATVGEAPGHPVVTCTSYSQEKTLDLFLCALEWPGMAQDTLEHLRVFWGTKWFSWCNVSSTSSDDSALRGKITVSVRGTPYEGPMEVQRYFRPIQTSSQTTTYLDFAKVLWTTFNYSAPPLTSCLLCPHTQA